MGTLGLVSGRGKLFLDLLYRVYFASLQIILVYHNGIGKWKLTCLFALPSNTIFISFYENFEGLSLFVGFFGKRKYDGSIHHLCLCDKDKFLGKRGGQGSRSQLPIMSQLLRYQYLHQNLFLKMLCGATEKKVLFFEGNEHPCDFGIFRQFFKLSEINI